MRENNLERFIKAQESEFKTALAEIKSGHKRVAVLQCTTLLKTMKKLKHI